MSRTVGVHDLRLYYLSILHIVELKCLSMSEMLEYLSVLIGNCYPHDMLSFFLFICPAQPVFVAVGISKAAVRTITEPVLPSFYVKRPAFRKHQGKLLSGAFIYLLYRGPRHLHAFGTLLLRKSLPVHEPDGLIFIDSHVYPVPFLRKGQRSEVLDTGKVTDPSAFYRPWHIYSSCPKLRRIIVLFMTYVNNSFVFIKPPAQPLMDNFFYLKSCLF